MLHVKIEWKKIDTIKIDIEELTNINSFNLTSIDCGKLRCM